MKANVFVITAVFLLIGINGFAADGDLIVSGNLGVGTPSPAYPLHVSTSVSGAKVANFTSTGTHDPSTTGMAGIGLTNTDTSGNSIWGISFAGYDTGGGWRHSGGIGAGKESSWTGGSGSYPAYIGFWTRPSGGEETERLRITSIGNVGIGTALPKGRLSVGFNNDDEIVMYSPGDNALAIQTTLDGQPLGSYGGAENRLLLQPIVGLVGIGTTTPWYTLHVNGTTYSYGGYIASDEKLKENIAPIESALDKILSMEGVTFNWKTGEEYKDKRFPEGKHLGVIAEEVEKVLPEIVRESSAEGEKAVAYTEIIPVLIEAIKEQNKAIQDLKAELEKMKTR